MVRANIDKGVPLNLDFLREYKGEKWNSERQLLIIRS